MRIEIDTIETAYPYATIGLIIHKSDNLDESVNAKISYEYRWAISEDNIILLDREESVTDETGEQLPGHKALEIVMFINSKMCEETFKQLILEQINS